MPNPKYGLKLKLNVKSLIEKQDFGLGRFEEDIGQMPRYLSKDWSAEDEESSDCD